MPGAFTSTTYEDLVSSLDGAIAWLESLEIEIGPTRVGKYRQRLAEILELQTSLDLAQASAHFRQYVNALFALHELALVHRTLGSGLHNPFVRERVRTSAGGPLFYTDEMPSNASNRARNVEFELLLAGHLVAGGLTLRDNSRADIAVDVDDRIVIVECKRPQSVSGLRRAVSDAKKQLQRSYQSLDGRNCRGVVAIDVTKLLNPSFQLVRRPRYEDVPELMEQQLSNFIDEHTGSWRRLFYRKTLALILRLSLMAELGVRETNLLYCQHYAMVDLDVAGRNRETLRALTSALERGIQMSVPYRPR